MQGEKGVWKLSGDNIMRYFTPKKPSIVYERQSVWNWSPRKRKNEKNEQFYL